MRPIHLARLEKSRPVLVLTRGLARPHLAYVSIAPITSRIRGLPTEVHLGPENGLDHECVVSVDNIRTIPVRDLGRLVGYLLPRQEPQLSMAITLAFDLA
ncbi:type II toxin-antitoxin system PemK/MazF family toxin [Intrasporangium sp.]|jgi:mRNA interferase MazF|uniref:type II toxin-antitoxin system PemK/MazF family toxin n=1 Tax=Intrasporangium sp. TaxID=1925024 RepID=UPI003365AA7F